jgi:hypothetical protein
MCPVRRREWLSTISSKHKRLDLLAKALYNGMLHCLVEFELPEIEEQLQHEFGKTGLSLYSQLLG